MEENKETSNPKEYYLLYSIVAAIVLVFSFVAFGLTGLRVFIGVMVVSLPFYIILGSFNFDEAEKIVSSILLGLTVFSSIVYLIGFIVSFKAAIIITFIALTLAGFLLRKYRKKQRNL